MQQHTDLRKIRSIIIYNESEIGAIEVQSTP